MKVRMTINTNTRGTNSVEDIKEITSTITIRVKTENELDLISYENLVDAIEKAIDDIPFDPYKPPEEVTPDNPETDESDS